MKWEDVENLQEGYFKRIVGIKRIDYLREYRSLDHLAVTYHIHVSNLHRNIVWCENEMIKLDMFSLPGMKSLRSDKYKEVTIDVTECIIERPKKGQKAYYSGKKTGHPKNPINN